MVCPIGVSVQTPVRSGVAVVRAGVAAGAAGAVAVQPQAMMATITRRRGIAIFMIH